MAHQYRKVLKTKLVGLINRYRRGRSRRLKPDRKEHNLTRGIRLRQLERIQGRVHHPHICTRGFDVH
jgi:hypothetical protein